MEMRLQKHREIRLRRNDDVFYFLSKFYPSRPTHRRNSSVLVFFLFFFGWFNQLITQLFVVDQKSFRFVSFRSVSFARYRAKLIIVRRHR